jgi:hypothetical protein
MQFQTDWNSRREDQCENRIPMCKNLEK